MKTEDLVPLTEEQQQVRDAVRDFVEHSVKPIANELDRRNEPIPESILKEMAQLGYFGMTIPESYGGFGLDHVSMCLVSEELSRGWLSVGSVGTRGVIAAAALLRHGTEEQRKRWLPGIASGEILCGIALTEPDYGSDLGGVQCRAEKTAGGWRITGEKTWVTMGNRARLLLVLCRTDPDPATRHRGLSVLFVEKEPGDDLCPPKITGKPIPCVGYHGLRTYAMHFDGVEVPGENLLGGQTGAGFKQTMTSLEAGRMQTASRAVGLAQAALEDAVDYAQTRVQFGKPIGSFQVIQHKIAGMATRTESARTLTTTVARRMDQGGRCDREASIAKSHASDAAYEVADANLQIHGAYGYSMEYDAQRFWRDARLLKIFEGTSEILQTVIARQTLDLA